MSQWVNGIERPTQQEFEVHDGIIRKYTILVLGDDFKSADSLSVLQDVLFSANTVRNYYGRLLMGGGSKRRRGNVDTLNVSDGKCMTWPSVFRTD
jgi:hypothetical protein